MIIETFDPMTHLPSLKCKTCRQKHKRTIHGGEQPSIGLERLADPRRSANPIKPGSNRAIDFKGRQTRATLVEGQMVGLERAQRLITGFLHETVARYPRTKSITFCDDISHGLRSDRLPSRAKMLNETTLVPPSSSENSHVRLPSLDRRIVDPQRPPA